MSSILSLRGEEDGQPRTGDFFLRLQGRGAQRDMSLWWMLGSKVNNLGRLVDGNKDA